MSDETKTKTESKTSFSPRSTQEIRKILQAKDHGFPIWAVEKFSKTHNLRWVSQRNFHNNSEGVDLRGYELVKNPMTGQIERRSEQMLAIIPKEIADEKKAEIRDIVRGQEQSVLDAIQSRRDKLQYQLDHLGYGKASANSKFSYNASKGKV